MGCFCYTKFQLAPVSAQRALFLNICSKLKFEYNRFLFGIWNISTPNIRRVLRGLGVPHRYTLDDREYSLVIRKQHFQVLVKDIYDGNGMANEPIKDLGDGHFELLFWYYDGGSDGQEEWRDFRRRVNKYFNFEVFKEKGA